MKYITKRRDLPGNKILEDSLRDARRESGAEGDLNTGEATGDIKPNSNRNETAIKPQ